MSPLLGPPALAATPNTCMPHINRARKVRGHRVTLVTDNSRHDLAGIWEGCDVRVWPSETPGALRDLVFSATGPGCAALTQ